jgi:hypothetical protein
MRTRPLTILATATLGILLLGACGKESNVTDTSKAVVDKQPEQHASEPRVVKKPSAQAGGIMDQAVNFSTPEAIEETLKSIEDEAGAAMAGQVKNAIDYMLVYDLSVNRNKAKLYKKLDGKTPNEILAMAD